MSGGNPPQAQTSRNFKIEAETLTKSPNSADPLTIYAEFVYNFISSNTLYYFTGIESASQ